jgi:hypothetical protein
METPANLAETAFLLAVTHFVLDFPLQGDTVALQKSRRTDNALSKAVPWQWWMTAHASSHALGVWLVTRSLPAACAELALHFSIDVLKCEMKISLRTDQALHLLCKAVYIVVLALTAAP